MEEIKQLIEFIKEAVGIIAVDEEIFSDIAICYRRMYSALMAKGFSRTDTMDIITSMKMKGS